MMRVSDVDPNTTTLASLKRVFSCPDLPMSLSTQTYWLTRHMEVSHMEV